MSTDSIDALPLTPAMFLILLALSGGERHGYGIIQDVNNSLTGSCMSPGTLYGAINRMLTAVGSKISTRSRRRTNAAATIA
jgi:DNA-binding PadR family transcriptional regulator